METTHYFMESLTLSNEVVLTALEKGHYLQVAKIYEAGIATGNATFESSAPAWETWDSTHLPFGRIAALANAEVVGWAALTPVSGRCVYSGVAEVSVYVDPAYNGAGLGTRLLNRLIEEAEANGIWTLQAGIMYENYASRALHKKCGFREIGYREKLGKLNGQWRDIVLMEKRSKFI
jgi:L-amino acid N-acyltransferase YncA